MDLFLRDIATRQYYRWIVPYFPLRVAYYLLIPVFDAIGCVFWSLPKPKRRIEASEADGWDYDEVLRRFGDCPSIADAEDPDGLFEPSVMHICPDTVAKRSDWHPDGGQPVQALTPELVRAHTTILTPAVRRYVEPTDEAGGLLLMEFIDGEQLAKCWPRLSLWSKLRIAWMLRQYILQLRRIPPPRPNMAGPLGPEPRDSIHPHFDVSPQRCFPTYLDLSRAFNDRLQYAKERGFAGSRLPTVVDDSRPLVLTHGDLNMRNIMIDKDGDVWLVDWSYSGYYPEWCEYVWMHGAAFNNLDKENVPHLFRWMMPFIAGPYFLQYAWCEEVPS